jgi:scyllo-inositol 2-dehydrogenase (NADP+)
MRVVVAGMGVQGPKRRKSAGDDFVCFVDPFRADADYKHIEDVPLGAYDAVLACIPDEPKADMLRYCVENRKSALVEKPLWVAGEREILDLEARARANGVVIYTAYNHRFEPHYARMREAIASGELGEIYSCRMFYGNGTARLARESAWREVGGGVFPDPGSHPICSILADSGSAISPTRSMSSAPIISRTNRRTMSSSPARLRARASNWR